jgi:hypothetical protein
MGDLEPAHRRPLRFRVRPRLLAIRLFELFEGGAACGQRFRHSLPAEWYQRAYRGPEDETAAISNGNQWSGNVKSRRRSAPRLAGMAPSRKMRSPWATEEGGRHAHVHAT